MKKLRSPLTTPLLPSLLSLLFSLLFLPLLANIAQPGIYNAGGTGTFSLLFPEDSAAYQQIEMQQEKVLIQLYRGFAVVKGTYWMYNTAADSLTIQVGYPVNASFPSRAYRDHLDIDFDDLYQLRVKGNGAKVAVRRERLAEDNYNMDNWYLWEQSFAPGELTQVEVWFLVNTNSAKILQGYNSDAHNAFLYLLETGSTWKGAIGQGEVIVQLRDGLQKEDIWGGSPDSIFRYQAEKQLLVYQFQNLNPQAENNLALVYGENEEGFDFAGVTAEAERYFATIDRLSQTAIDLNDSPLISLGDAFVVHSFNSFAFTLWAIGIGVPLVLLLFLVWLIRKIIRRRRV
jgi:hypothetical protein